MGTAKRFICCCLTVVCAASLHARQTDTLSLPRQAERAFSKTQYEYVYRDNPAMLSWWDYAPYSVIGVRFDYEKGDLHHPQTYDRLLKGQVETESILHLPEKGWTFHGRFVYEYGMADSVRANLSYGLRSNGSPSFYFCRKPASEWNIQRYGFEATASKQLGERWSVGGQFDYTGDLSFRKSDVRNQQTALGIHIVLSATYRPSEHHVLSIGADYLRNKEKPLFSIIYSSGPDYTIYLMNGLGTYITDRQSDMVWIENTPSFLFQWMQTGDRNRFSLSYRFSSGHDQWRYQGTQAATRQEKWTRYDFTAHRIALSEIVYLRRSLLNIRGELELVSGKGKSWNRTTSLFIRNYDYKGTHGNLAVEWHPYRSVLQELTIGGTYESEKRRDKSYDYRFNHSTMTAFARAQIGFDIGSVGTYLAVNGAYTHNPSVRHLPKAATETNNEYTKWIGIPLARWLGTDFARFGGSLGVEIPLRRTLLEIGLSADYALPTGSVAPFYEGTDFLRMKCLVNIYF